MDGLECSVIYRSSLNCELRIDSEYHKKRFLQDDSSIHKYHTVLIGAIATVSDGQHGYHEEDASSPIHMLTAKNTKDWFANLVDTIRIAKWVDDNNKRSSLSVDDIILSTRGTVGKCALVKADILPANLDQDVARISFTNAQIAPAFVLCYLNSTFGQDWMVRNQTGMVQQGLSLEKVRQIPIPQMSITFQDKICEIVENAFARKKESVWSYDAANRILDDMIGIKDLCATTISKKSFFQSFVKTGRLDAEYYQPKYDEYWKQLQKFETTSIPTEYEVFKNSGTNYADGVNDIGVIKTKQLSNNGIDTNGVESFFTIQACIENKSTYLRKNDVVFASMGVGSLGKVSLFFPDGEKQFVTDSTLRIYRAKTSCRVLPEVLCVFLLSHLGQEMIYRYVVGSTGIINIYDDDMAKIPIPILNMDVQKEIAAKVQESFALRKQSRQLLEYAKQAVEMAIEQGEGVALKWLKDKIPVEV